MSSWLFQSCRLLPISSVGSDAGSENMLRKSGIKAAAKEITKLALEIDKTSLQVSRQGFALNAFGTYWDERLVARLADVYEQLIAAASTGSEQEAAQYRLAALLKDSLRLEEGAKLCEEIIRLRPNNSHPEQNLLAYIEARRGNMDRARSIARALDENPFASSFRISEADLVREQNAGQASNHR